MTNVILVRPGETKLLPDEVLREIIHAIPYRTFMSRTVPEGMLITGEGLNEKDADNIREKGLEADVISTNVRTDEFLKKFTSWQRKEYVCQFPLPNTWTENP